MSETATSNSHPPSPWTLTPAQVSIYLKHLSLPEKYHIHIAPAEQPNFPKTALALATLTTAHLTRFPYDNLDLHYNAAHAVDIQPQSVFRKFLGQGEGEDGRPRGRGGYCMENSIFFNRVLLALGFDAYTTGVRIRLREAGVPRGNYIGWVHLVNIVTLPGHDGGSGGGERYAIDVGFGGDGPTAPLRLLDGHERTNLGRQESRIVRGKLELEQPLGRSREDFWIYQVRNGPGLDWNAFYAFQEGVEFFDGDFEVMNAFTGESEKSFQRWNCLLVRFLRQGEEPKGTKESGVEIVEPKNGAGESELKVVGKVMLVNGDVKLNMGGKTKIVETCKTEAEREDALRRWFNIRLSEKEKEGIKGWRMELK